MKIIISLSISMLFGVQTYAQENRIKWSENYRLNWNDFQGISDVRSDLKAMTYSGIGFEVKCVNGDLDYRVWTYFDKSMSWLNDSEPSEILLEHERVHFDITELFARKFTKKLQSLRYPCGRDVEKIQQLYDDNMVEYDGYQQRYDKETNHSIDKGAQKQWQIKIANALRQLKPYTSELFH